MPTRPRDRGAHRWRPSPPKDPEGSPRRLAPTYANNRRPQDRERYSRWPRVACNAHVSCATVGVTSARRARSHARGGPALGLDQEAASSTAARSGRSARLPCSMRSTICIPTRTKDVVFDPLEARRRVRVLSRERNGFYQIAIVVPASECSGVGVSERPKKDARGRRSVRIDVPPCLAPVVARRSLAPRLSVVGGRCASTAWEPSNLPGTPSWRPRR
jgi:hypothetical protein